MRPSSDIYLDIHRGSRLDAARAKILRRLRSDVYLIRHRRAPVTAWATPRSCTTASVSAPSLGTAGLGRAGHDLAWHGVAADTPAAPRLLCLEDWELRFTTRGPHLSGYGASIRKAPGKVVWGILYALTHDDRASLNVAERLAYDSAEVTIRGPSTGSSFQAFTYVPHEDSQIPGDPDKSYIDGMMAVALTKNIAPLVADLQRYLDSPKDENKGAK